MPDCSHNRFSRALDSLSLSSLQTRIVFPVSAAVLYGRSTFPVPLAEPQTGTAGYTFDQPETKRKKKRFS